MSLDHTQWYRKCSQHTVKEVKNVNFIDIDNLMRMNTLYFVTALQFPYSISIFKLSTYFVLRLRAIWELGWNKIKNLVIRKKAVKWETWAVIISRMWQGGNYDTFLQLLNSSLQKSVILSKCERKTENSTFTQYEGLHNISYILFK